MEKQLMEKQKVPPKKIYIEGKSMFSSKEIKPENDSLTILSFLQKSKYNGTK
jgi:hypothetical protein